MSTRSHRRTKSRIQLVESGKVVGSIDDEAYRRLLDEKKVRKSRVLLSNSRASTYSFVYEAGGTISQVRPSKRSHRIGPSGDSGVEPNA